MSFFSELHRRNVFRVAASYVVVGWLIMQVVDVVDEPLDLPAWFGTVAIYTTALYAPVLREFDSPENALSTLREIYADDTLRWPSKLHDIALLAAYFGDPELAFQAIGEPVRNTSVRLQAVWYPLMSEVRQLPGLKELVTELNLVSYWRTHGWADACRPLANDDFACSWS